MEMPVPSRPILDRKAEIVRRLRAVLAPGRRRVESRRAGRLRVRRRWPPTAARRWRSRCRARPRRSRRCCGCATRSACRSCRAVRAHSLSGGALPTEDAVILGVARLTDVLETRYEDRVIRVQTGRTNLSVTGAVEADGFFYAPDHVEPSSRARSPATSA